jgi:hypothetical protein
MSGRVLNLASVERDIEEELRRAPPLREPDPIDYAPPSVRMPPMPDYVEHQEGVSQIGKISAAAVVLEVEAAAKEIEAMGAALVDAAKQCELMTAGVHQVAADVIALAGGYRNKAKQIFAQIQACTLMTDEVRNLCKTLAGKIAASE